MKRHVQFCNHCKKSCPVAEFHFEQPGKTTGTYVRESMLAWENFVTMRGVHIPVSQF